MRTSPIWSTMPRKNSFRRGAAIGRGYPFTFDGAVLTASDTWAVEATAYVFSAFAKC